MTLLRSIAGCGLLIGLTGGMNAQCNGKPCGPGDPNYDPQTGLCPSTQPTDDGPGEDTLGPAGPGTGGLPTQPQTQTPDSAGEGVDPDSVNVDVYGLNGIWMDNGNGRDTCVIHTPSEVAGNYLALYECDHREGTRDVSTTLINFRGQLASGVITGTNTTCKFGFDSGNGFVDAPMTLTVGADGKSLSGSWHSDFLNEDVPFSLTRKTVGACGTQ